MPVLAQARDPLAVRSRARSRRTDPIPARPPPPPAHSSNRTTAARPDARPRFTGPPPMDKVRPESQSEYTPVTPCPSGREPARGGPTPYLLDLRRHRLIHQIEQPPPGQTLGQDSPDRRQWIKSGPKVRASTRR